MSGHKLKTVTTLHGTDIMLVGQDASFARATKFGLERSDAVTAVSKFLRDKTPSWFEISCPISVIPDFVDTRRFTPSAKREATLVHVTSFRPVKRTLDAVRAFYLVRKRVPAKLVLVGKGPEEPQVRELAAKLGILKHLKFVGEDPDVADHLKGAGLLLSTSEFEGFGMSVLEAMACGLPVVTTDSGGTAEVVSESCARVVAVGDVEGLAAAAVEILRDENLARSMGESGRRRAEEMFDVDRVVPQYESLYERVCGASNAENLSV
jgi:N-acetyl-alpha-D-glucosaminyl L-malate synthase BshA